MNARSSAGFAYFGGLRRTRLSANSGASRLYSNASALLPPVRGKSSGKQIEEGLLRIQARGDEARADHLAAGRLHADHLAAFDHDPPRLAIRADLAAAVAHRRGERLRQPRRAAQAHLRLGGARQQHRDVVAEAALAQVDFAQAVEEQQPRPDHRVLELPLDELQRRKRTRFEQQPAFRAFLQEVFPFGNRNRRPARLGTEDALEDRPERVAPVAQPRRIARAELARRSAPFSRNRSTSTAPRRSSAAGRR